MRAFQESIADTATETFRPRYHGVQFTFLAALLSGPVLSLPSMLVLRSVMGTKKTVVFVTLVVVMATITGMIYGALF